MTLRGQPIRCRLTLAATAFAVVLAGAGVRPVSASSAPHAKKHDAKQQVEDLEEQWRVAQLAGDTATMDKMLSDDYIGISMTGEVDTKTQQLRRAIDRKLILTKLELSDMKVKLVGAVAIVTSRAQVEGSMDGQAMKGMFRYTRIYQHLPSGAWKITSFEATREHRHRSDAEGEGAD
ncbi:MAG TPA: nuclear transport factor 2 family protein [Edaphobacter sp.]|nr:nuclear transport factor 2 family protein [Edaphobacter sp.]